MKAFYCQQGTQEWFELRTGKVTASHVADALSFLKRGDKKGGDTAARAALKATIAGEILTGEMNMDGYVSSFMQWGTENEPYAIAAYEVLMDVSVDKVGFVVHPRIDRAGASPDGLVGDDGGLEIKCPKTSTHIGYMTAGVLPEEYEPQVLFNLACTERDWWDFVSFDGRLPARHSIFRVRVFREDYAERIAEIEAGVAQFLNEVDALIAAMEKLNPEVVPPPKKAEPHDDALLTEADKPAWWDDPDIPEFADLPEIRKDTHA